MEELVSRGGAVGGQVPLGIGNGTVVVPNPPQPSGGGYYWPPCYKHDWNRSGWRENEYCPGYKFAWSYELRSVNASSGKRKVTVTMENFKKNANNRWIDDYSSYCKLTFSTKLYEDRISQCNDKGWDGKEGYNTQVHYKSKNKTFDFKYGSVSDDVYSSYVICRHKGIDFKYNADGDPIP